MRLTQTMRDAYVRSIMNDLPKTDYRELANKEVRAAVAARFAREFPGMDIDSDVARNWLNHSGTSLPNPLGYYYDLVPRSFSYRDDPELAAKLNAFAARHKDQERVHNELEYKIKGAARACTTRKQLAEAMPEFARYLPEEEAAAIRTLPAVVNLVSEFTAAGWEARNNAGQAVAA